MCDHNGELQSKIRLVQLDQPRWAVDSKTISYNLQAIVQNQTCEWHQWVKDNVSSIRIEDEKLDDGNTVRFTIYGATSESSLTYFLMKWGAVHA